MLRVLFLSVVVLLLTNAAGVLANPLVFRCADQPLPEFTLGAESSLSKEEIEELCSCIWNSLGPGKKKVAEAIHRGEEPQIPGLDLKPEGVVQAFSTWFGEAIRGCSTSADMNIPYSGIQFSKANMQWMFSMSRSQWNTFANTGALGGEAMVHGDPDTGVAMTAPIEGGFIIIDPEFSEEAAPDFVQLSLGYRGELAERMTVGKLNEDLDRAQTDLSPEFEVHGRAERLTEGTVLYLTIFPMEAATVGQTNDDALVLSKEDAFQMFQLSLEDWKNNLMQGQAAGVMDYTKLSPTEFSMTMETPDGLLIVTPSYEAEYPSTPYKLEVVIVFQTQPQASVINSMDATGANEFFREVMQTMQPELTVIGKLMKQENEFPTVVFNLFKKAAYPLIDIINEGGSGCRTSCINPSW